MDNVMSNKHWVFPLTSERPSVQSFIHDSHKIEELAMDETAASFSV